MPRSSPQPAARSTRPHEVRIIGGQWRRTRLAVADKPGLRPTPDRVRETLFNWLASLAGATGGELPGWHCIDVFAGTGALGFEAASRGAAVALLCEQDPALVAQMKATREKLQADAVRVERGDGVAQLERAPAGQWHAVEAARAWSDEALAPFGLSVYRHLKAGAVHAHLLRAAIGD
ncbi:MAG: 16S rRNA (guanine(966)-N(2))-methyltransferase RsmD [Variovorax paradoxus]|uniref:16S rRNA (Guanine(966)-N(2))-methyltransferase RsmD n=1 Tax=Variovorax paradoxus TaxID=34073 RepID=A0A2W5R493_VARPD|nr:MAG: 16S rRNA (guanine(966)-N(2))-methyltransferase RsmD [Variovorax paradoxus]